jgi:hypothetical protein
MTEPGNIKAIRRWLKSHRSDNLDYFNTLVERTKDPTDKTAEKVLCLMCFGFEAGLLQASRIVRKRLRRKGKVLRELCYEVKEYETLAEDIKNYTPNSINESENEWE